MDEHQQQVYILVTGANRYVSSFVEINAYHSYVVGDHGEGLIFFSLMRIRDQLRTLRALICLLGLV